jgi:hypothetical protein
VFAVRGGAHAQRPRIVELLHKQGAARLFRQRAVVGLDLRDLQQLGYDRLVLVRTLPQVDRREVKAEHLHGAHQRLQARVGEHLRVVRGE